MPIYLIIAIAVAVLLIVIVIMISLNLYGRIMRSRADRRAAETRARQDAEWKAVMAKRDRRT